MVLEGDSRKRPAETCEMARQTLRDWVHCYNADGLSSLASRSYVGPPRHLSAENLSDLAVIVASGPTPATDGVGVGAIERSSARHQGAMEREPTFVHRRQTAQAAWLQASMASCPPSAVGSRSPGGLQELQPDGENDTLPTTGMSASEHPRSAVEWPRRCRFSDAGERDDYRVMMGRCPTTAQARTSGSASTAFMGISEIAIGCASACRSGIGGFPGEAAAIAERIGPCSRAFEAPRDVGIGISPPVWLSQP